MQLPASGHTLHCSDKASLVGSSAPSFPFFENKSGRASSTDLMLSNLYILQTNFSTSFVFFLLLALPLQARKEACGALGTLSKLFEWVYVEDVVSQPVEASKGRRADAEPVGRFSKIALMLKYFRFVAVSDIMYRLGQGMWGTCVTRSIKTSVSLADKPMLCRGC